MGRWCPYFRWAHTRIMIYLKEIVLLVFIITAGAEGKCLDTGCSDFEKGAQCYAMTPNGPFGPSGLTRGFDCARSAGLCWQEPHCQCRNKKCRDTGCSGYKWKWDTKGRCSERKLNKFCVESKKLCQRSKLASYGNEMVASSKCRWTNWIDRDNPSATGDWENSIWPPHPIYGTGVGPGTDCEYSQYRVRIKGTTTQYSDVNSLPPNPWVIHDMPKGIYCRNAVLIWKLDTAANPNPSPYRKSATAVPVCFWI